MYLDDAVKATATFEGAVPHLYLDSKGNITVGSGRMIPNLAAALAIPFFPPGRVAADYQWTYSVWVTAEWMRADLAQELAHIDAMYAKTFPHSYPSWPAAAKIAMLDMAYNIGPTKLLLTYPRMMQAATDGDWNRAAEESARNAGEKGFERRNQWTAQMFSAAAQEQAAA